MSVWWFIGAAIVITAIARHRSKQIEREAQRREKFREARLRAGLHREAETLWPDSNADRWPDPRCPIRHVCDSPNGPMCPCKIAAGVAEAEQWANHG